MPKILSRYIRTPSLNLSHESASGHTDGCEFYYLDCWRIRQYLKRGRGSGDFWPVKISALYGLSMPINAQERHLKLLRSLSRFHFIMYGLESSFSWLMESFLAAMTMLDQICKERGCRGQMALYFAKVEDFPDLWLNPLKILKKTFFPFPVKGFVQPGSLNFVYVQMVIVLCTIDQTWRFRVCKFIREKTEKNWGKMDIFRNENSHSYKNPFFFSVLSVFSWMNYHTRKRTSGLSYVCVRLGFCG